MSRYGEFPLDGAVRFMSQAYRVKNQSRFIVSVSKIHR